MKRQRHIKISLSMCLFLAVAYVPTRAVAEDIPPHLGGILSTLAREADRTLPVLNADDAAITHAAQESLKNLKRIGGLQYARPPLDVNKQVEKLGAALGLSGTAQANFVQDIWHMPDTGVIKKISSLDPSLQPEKILGVLDEARSGGGLKTHIVLPLDDGRSITVDWQPETGKTTLDVASDGSVGEEYVTTIEGNMPLTYDAEKGGFTMMPEAMPIPPQIATEDILDARRSSILGEWSVDNIGMLVITAADEESGDVARDPSAVTASVDAKRRQLEKLKSDKYHLWRNTATGAEERQDKFKRLGDEWTYVGEIPKDPDQIQKIAALEADIAALEKEGRTGQPPAVALDPIGFEAVKSYHKARALTVEFRMKADCVFTMDEAYFDGRTLAARTTQTQTCSMGDHLPAPVRTDLAGGWNPPLWLMAKVEDMQDNKIMSLRVSQHGMRVKYDPDSYKVSGILQPHMDKSGLGQRPETGNIKYTVAQGAMP